jgi:hypothetical protein
VAAMFFTMDRMGRVHWLLATPMSRVRMFRMVAIPLVAIPLLTGLVSLVAETSGDTRGVLANRRDVADRPYVHGALSTTDIGAVIPSRHAGGGWTSPSPEVMAERVQGNLRKRFFLDVSLERIATRMEPLRESSGPMKSHDSARLGAVLDEIQGDLEDDLLAADRILRCLYAAAGLLLVLLVLQFELRRGVGRWGAGVLVVFTFLLTFPEGPNPWQAPLRWRDGLAAAVVALPVFGQVLSFLGFATVALALWRSCRASFRQLESTDLRSGPLGSLPRPR